MNDETVGDLIRAWRSRRRMSQLTLALEADISARHLSFVESGRSSASRDLLQRLSERLSLPLRERNRLLVAGGYAPIYSAKPFDSPSLDAVRHAVDTILRAHMPYPAILVGRLYSLEQANAAALDLLKGLPRQLATDRMNVLRASLDPDGLAPRIENLAEWRQQILNRVRADFVATNDPAVGQLYDELMAIPTATNGPAPAFTNNVAVPLVIRTTDGRTLSLLSTTMVFGTANDVTLSELTLESFFPNDDETRRYFFRRFGGADLGVSIRTVDPEPIVLNHIDRATG